MIGREKHFWSFLRVAVLHRFYCTYHNAEQRMLVAATRCSLSTALRTMLCPVVLIKKMTTTISSRNVLTFITAEIFASLRKTCKFTTKRPSPLLVFTYTYFIVHLHVLLYSPITRNEHYQITKFLLIYK